MSSNHSFTTVGLRYLALAREEPVRAKRDDLLDIAANFFRAAESGAALARAADNVRDRRRLRELDRNHDRNLAVLPYPEDDPWNRAA